MFVLKHKKLLAYPCALAFILLCLSLPWGSWMWAMLDPFQAFAVPNEQAAIFWNTRLPRVLFALCVGASLGLAGAMCQGLFRNPLADPGLLGITSGATCGAAVSIVFSAAIVPHFMPEAWRGVFLPLMCFVGAFGACMLLSGINRWLTRGSLGLLLLFGMGFNGLAMSGIGLSSYMAEDSQLRQLWAWSMGSLSGASLGAIIVLVVALGMAYRCMRRQAQAIDALMLGPCSARHLGVDAAPLQRRLMLWTALLTGLCMAWCGFISFVGLMAPHMVRLCGGNSQRLILPWSMAVGALLLLLADTCSRMLAYPAEIPISIFTSVLILPVCASLLYKQRLVQRMGCYV